MSTRLPPVSIGIPFFNAEKFLLDAIRSVFAQTHQEWELILVDDGSTDGSLEIARSIDDPRVRVVADGKNMRLAARLNQVHSLAKYDFIARMDADDLMAADRIQKQLSFLVENPDVDLVTTGVCSITDDSVPYGVRVVGVGHVPTPYRVLSGAHGIVHAAIVGRKRWFQRNPYDPGDHWGEDYRLWVRSLLANDLSIGFMREPLYFYREEGSASVTKMLDGQRLGRALFLAHGPEMVGLGRTTFLIGKSLLKSGIIRVAAAARLTGSVVRLRSPVADRDVLEAVRNQIAEISTVNVRTMTCAD